MHMTETLLNIGIAGLGLIGGSFAKAIKQNTGHTVYGYDISDEVMRRAELDRAIDGRLSSDAVGHCDLVIIALYPSDTVSFIRDNAVRFSKDAIVMDCCGVKEAVATEAEQIAHEYGFTYIGGHPMAGIEFSGFEYSRHSLFKNASMILTPSPHVSAWAIDRVKELCLSIGFSNIQISTPGEHDRMIAFTSQLAHVVSSAYVKSDAAIGHKGFSAGSYRDMTRVARLNENMWTELFLDNAEYLTSEIDGLIGRLSQYRDAIRSGNREEVKRLLMEGRERKMLLDGEEYLP